MTHTCGKPWRLAALKEAYFFYFCHVTEYWPLSGWSNIANGLSNIANGLPSRSNELSNNARLQVVRTSGEKL